MTTIRAWFRRHRRVDMEARLDHYTVSIARRLS